jgi:alpha-glucosidase
MNFRITAENEKGILYQDRNGLAYNFDGELGDGSVHFTRREEDQKIYGLGDKSGHVNKNGRSFELGAGDAMGFKAEYSDPLYKHVPFYICENHAGSYGLFYDTYSNGRVNFGEEHDNYFEPFNSIRYEEENMIFYLFTGTPLEIIQKFIFLTGGIAPVPRWAFSYCGSTMEYTDAPNADEQLRGFVKKCGETGIKAGGFWLSSG